METTAVISTFDIVIGVIIAFIALATLIFTIVTWSISRVRKTIEGSVSGVRATMEKQIDTKTEVILAKIELVYEKLSNLKASGTDYSHALNDKVEEIKETVYTNFLRRVDAKESLDAIIAKLDHLDDRIQSRSTLGK